MKIQIIPIKPFVQIERILIRNLSSVERNWNNGDFAILANPYDLVKACDHEIEKTCDQWNRLASHEFCYKLEDLYLMEGQRDLIFHLASKYSIKIREYNKKILWVGGEIDIIEFNENRDDINLVNKFINKKYMNRLNYPLR
jgi:hypothetical protein